MSYECPCCDRVFDTPCELARHLMMPKWKDDPHAIFRINSVYQVWCVCHAGPSNEADFAQHIIDVGGLPGHLLVCALFDPHQAIIEYLSHPVVFPGYQP